MNLYFQVFLLGLSVNVESTHPIPNIGVVFNGYDVLYGNPRPTTGDADPGFRQAIFEPTFKKKTKTPDNKWWEPDGLNVVDCSGTCSLDFSSKEIAGTKDYQSTLETSTSVEGSRWGAKFSASVDYKRVSDQSSKYESVYTHSTAQCCAYVIDIEEYTLPSVTQNFLAGLATLPVTYNEEKYMKFIGTFGTHYVSKASMGALFGQQSEFKKKEWSKMLSEGIDIKAAASFAGAQMTAKVDHQTSHSKKMAETFSSVSSEQRIYSVGAKPPEDSKANTWIQSTVTNPMPIRLELRQIDTLIGLTSFGNQVNHSSLKAALNVTDNVKKALSNYCSYLKKKGKLSDCVAPGPDPPFPKPEHPIKQLFELVNTLSKITPKKDNRFEWSRIREEASYAARHLTRQDTFKEMMDRILSVLASTQPTKKNKDEWGVIRVDINNYEQKPYDERFWALVEVLSTIKPGKSNRHEWDTIRTKCEDLLAQKPGDMSSVLGFHDMLKWKQIEYGLNDMGLNRGSVLNGLSCWLCFALLCLALRI
jgi:hypothetical protein